MISPQSLDFLEGIAAPVVATNLEGLIIYSNAEAQQLLGFSAQEMKLRNWWEHFPAVAREQLKTAFARAEPGTTFAAPCAIKQKDGGTIPVIVHLSVVVNQNRSPEALLTMLHRIAAPGSNLPSDPRSPVTQEQEQIQEAVYQARKTQAIGALAAGLAHDFNNILTAILSHLDLILHAPQLSPDLREHATYAKSSGVRAADLVSRLLAFSRQARPVLTPLNLSSLLDEAILMLRRKLGNQIELRTLPRPEESWTVDADANHIMQLLTNLCLNGRDAMPNGGILSVGLANVVFGETDAKPPRRSGDFVRLTVSDTGKGISREVLERLFELYFTTKEFSKGTGLGLTIANSIVCDHGGWMEAESEAGVGTHFHAYFPRSQQASMQRDMAREAMTANNPSLEGRERILLVDDEEMVRLVARAVLGYRGYTILEAADGEEALQKFTSAGGRFDLVILDLHMPKLDGMEVLRRLRQMDPRLPVIVLSGDTPDEFAARLTEAGATAILQKPFDNLELLRQVRRGLDATPVR